VTEPEWARWVLTAVLAGITATCLLRLATFRGRRPAGDPPRHEDVGQVIMGVCMITMVLSWTDVLPTPVWIALFGAQAIAFAALLLRGRSGAGHENWVYTNHVMASAAMVYMVVAMTGPDAMAGMPGMPMAPLAGAFGFYFLGYAVWSVLRATRVVGVATAGGAVVTAGGEEVRQVAVLRQPLLVEGCRALMAGGMAFLLLAG
jgi:hypothetical protein